MKSSNTSNTGGSGGRRFSSHYGASAAGYSSLGSITSGGGTNRYELLVYYIKGEVEF